MRLTTGCVLIAVAISAQSCRPTATTHPAGDIPMRLGESIRLADTDLVVRADSLADSRCPTGVNCIVAGTVRVDFTALGGGGRESFTLGLTGESAENEQSAPTVEVLGHTFRLRRADPYPVYGTAVPDSAYRLIVVAR